MNNAQSLTTTLSRRDFLAGATTAGVAPLLAAKNIPIALELYSVRKDAETDLPGVLKKVAQMGYQGVEFAGFHGHEAPDVKKMLADNGLKVSSSHTGLKLLQGDEFTKTVEFNLAIGNRTVIIPSWPKQTSADGWRKAADQIGEIAQRLRRHKMRVGFHNHTVEFQPVDGQIPLELIFDNTSKDVLVQIDIGHAVRAGADPLAYIRKYAGRCHSFHMKDYSPNNEDVLLGEGVVKFKEIFLLAETLAGTQWYIVEQERYPVPPLESVDRCLKSLKQLLGRA